MIEKKYIFNFPIQNPTPLGIIPNQAREIEINTYKNRKDDNDPTMLFVLKSNRKAYSSEYLLNKYGGIEKKLGTNLGKG